MRMGGFQVFKKERNTQGKRILAGDSETIGHREYLANRSLPEALIFTILNSN